MIKNLFNRLICLCRGHKWITWSSIYDENGREIGEYTCSRCLKTKEEVI